MAKIKLFKKISLISMIITFLLMLSFSLSLYFAIGRFNQIDGTKSRQYFSQFMDELSQKKEPNIDGVDYTIISFNGTVLKSTAPGFVENQIIELKILAGFDGAKYQNRTYFVSPLIENNIQVGILILLIDNNLITLGVSGNIGWFVFLTLFFVVTVCLILKMILIIKKDIEIPLHIVNKVAKKMMYGDYSEKLLYDYTDEIGILCHNMEILRDELLSSQQRESELKKNEKFLLACISHDLKTPLSIILGTAESLKDNMISTAQATTTILNKANTLNKLIDDILEHTKTELSEFSINISECYAKKFFEKELTDLHSQAKKKGLIILVSECPDCIINIDTHRISQVMQNLSSNAIKYTPHGGTIKIDFETKNRNLIVSIKDTGSGISAQDLPFIFDRFFRGEKARNLGIPGSGLGLTITKYIIEKHGGTIECDALLGKGTEMRFSLPLDR